jgi:hypothetical protein
MIRSRCSSPLVLTLLCAWLLAGGCSKAPTPPRLVPVSGRVVYKGRPVGLASIEFLPEASSGDQAFAAAGQTSRTAHSRCKPTLMGRVPCPVITR